MRSPHAAAGAAAVAALAALLVTFARAVPVDIKVPQLDDRFNANRSLVDKPVMCSEEERSCLALGLLFNPDTRQCVPLGYTRKTFNSHCVYAAKQCTYDGDARRLQATCLTPTECRAAGSRVGRPLAFTGRCAARDAVCACDGRPPAGLHLFGGAQCDCRPENAAPTRHRAPKPQPLEPGRCNVPDFTLDLHGRDAPTGGAPVRVKCPKQQAQCTARNEVWFKGACWPLLEQGPCDDYFILRFSPQHPNRFAGCYRNETCQEGRLKFAADPRECHPAALFDDGDDGGRLRRDAHGLWRVSFRGDHPRDADALFVCAAPGEELPPAPRGGRERKRPQRRTRRRRGKNQPTGDGKGKCKGKGKGKGKGKAKKQENATTISGRLE